MGVLNLKALRARNIPVVKSLGKAQISVIPSPKEDPAAFQFEALDDLKVIALWPRKTVSYVISAKQDPARAYPLICKLIEEWTGCKLGQVSLFNKRSKESLIHMDAVESFLSENVSNNSVVDTHSHIPHREESLGLPPPSYLDLNGSIIAEVQGGKFEKPVVIEVILDSPSLYATRDLAYRKWRNWLKSIESTHPISPFERNSVFWGELWKALCSCNVLIYVVAATNPDFFYNQHIFDAIDHIESRRLEPKGVKCVVLMNKCDLLTDKQCDLIEAGYKARNLDIILYSATSDRKRLSSPSDLVAYIDRIEVGNAHKDIACVGFPNVGKSSVINSLLGEVKCAVSSTAGKTKCVSSYPLGDDINLLDVPGFVQPTLVDDTAQLLIDGVLNLEQSPKSVLTLTRGIITRVGFIQLLQILKAPITSEAFDILELYSEGGDLTLLDEEVLKYTNKQTFRFAKGGRGGNPDLYKLVQKILQMIWSHQIILLTPPSCVSVADFMSEEAPHVMPDIQKKSPSNTPRTRKVKKNKSRTLTLSVDGGF